MLHCQRAVLVFTLAADAAGQQQWRQLAHQAALRGKRVAVLPLEAYGGHKDASAAGTAGGLAGGAGPMAAGQEGLAVRVDVVYCATATRWLGSTGDIR